MNNKIFTLIPGIALSAAVTGAAVLLERGETALFGRAWLESLVLAILLGSLVRTFATVPAAFEAGVRFSAKVVLELAVMLLGASVSAGAIVAHGWPLLGGIALSVVLAIAFSYTVGRLLRLPHKMAVLVACGNSICGNSAIAAVAPVIDAQGKDVASSIAFTAVLGVVVVLVLPVLDRVLALTPLQYGIFAGMTVYAVPQVLAAAAPVSQASLHVGTLVKLVRVLMLGPVVLGLSVFRRDGARRVALPLAQLVPWFIVGFLALMTLRSVGALPSVVLEPAHVASGWLTSMSMAALGLGVDARAVLRAGGKVTATVVVSLVGLGAISWGLIALLGIR
ncbi:membrane protein [Massilia sp. JS1662]|nr:putative sulfate exporter family transporter [Massilia sp. JS1662]KGF78241.1 membrane protein [Massilia sp. JS1662]